MPTLTEVNSRDILNPITTKSDGRTGQGTVSGRQFLWGVGLPKGNGGVQRFPRAGRRLALECKGRRELDCKDEMSNVFLPGELIGLLRAERMGRTLEEAICYQAVLLGITRASMNTQSFISEASRDMKCNSIR
ncbi:hypothetical protein QVD17_00560 [Tagetes erecta]|uniref:Uncharacterized protein n=1 Tax=Tagetes erecta TaxID=13708 RepID=A0AAD8P7H8_TARER|nr:hypothetical protein QVD17_00560 [Tagetes erecta]